MWHDHTEGKSVGWELVRNTVSMGVAVGTLTSSQEYIHPPHALQAGPKHLYSEVKSKERYVALM